MIFLEIFIVLEALKVGIWIRQSNCKYVLMHSTCTHGDNILQCPTQLNCNDITTISCTKARTVQQVADKFSY